MAAASLDTLLHRLEEAKRRFGEGEGARVHGLLARLARRRFPDAVSLVRFHEALLFLRAYPHDRRVLTRAEGLLRSFHRRVARLLASDPEEADSLTEPEVAGIAGTRYSVPWGYEIVRHLADSHPRNVEIDWEAFDNDGLLVELLKRFVPLFEDAAYVEYPVPSRAWIRAARGPRESDLGWLLRHLEGLDVSDPIRATLYEALSLPIEWKMRGPASRTTLRLPAGRAFHHDGPLLGRRDVSLDREIERTPRLPVRKLSAREGARFLSLARDAMTMRIRELYGFTHGDSRHVRVAEAGRGVRLYVWGVPPERRMPLLAYHAVLIVKNGVPVGYAETLSFFERTEFGLNLFYTFRDGESAWIYARLLRLFRQLLGITVISVEPYQLGSHNPEAIDSGAFWFYRKLGFRPVRPALARLVAREERRIASRPGYRTSGAVLRKLAAGHVIYEAPSFLDAELSGAVSAAPPHRSGDWDRFHFRHLGMAVQRRVAGRFRGDDRKMRAAAEASVARALGVHPARWSATRRQAFAALAPLLALIPELSRWPQADKEAAVRIVQAKAAPEESRYVRLLQRHAKLRAAMIRLGSYRNPSPA